MSLKIKAKILSELLGIICTLGCFAPNTIKAVEGPTLKPDDKSVTSTNNTPTNTTDGAVEQLDYLQFSRLYKIALYNPSFAKELQNSIKNGAVTLYIDLSPYADTTFEDFESFEEELYSLLTTVRDFCVLAQNSDLMSEARERIQNHSIPTSPRIDALFNTPIPFCCEF